MFISWIMWNMIIFPHVSIILSDPINWSKQWTENRSYFSVRFLTLVCSRPASASRSGSSHLGKFVWESNLALVFKAVQSRPMTTFPESWHDYPEQYFWSLGWQIYLPGYRKWRYKQNYDVNKWQMWMGGISRSNIGITWDYGWVTLLAKHVKFVFLCLITKQ